MKSTRIIYHVLFWIIYLLFKCYLNFETGTFANDEIVFSGIFKLVVLPQLLFLSIKIPLVYFLFYLIDRYLDNSLSLRKSFLLVFILFSVAISFYILINHIVVLNGLYDMHIEFNKGLILGSLIYSFFILCFISGIAVAIKLIRLSIKQKKNAQELMKMKLETELSLLKSQINPHFLFNTLNNIYALAIKKSDDTAAIVMKLSEILRFMLYESDRGRIFISREIKLLEDFIQLEKIRYNDRLCLNITKKISNPEAKITPLLLLHLIENAFKHGASSTAGQVFIHILIEEKDNHFIFEIKNNKEDRHQKLVEGIGLKNLRRQLELTYNDFDLKIEDQLSSFQVTLSINLESYGKV